MNDFNRNLSQLMIDNQGGGGGGQPQGQVDNPNEITSFDFSKMGGLSGSFEIQKYLYETGIQNAFNEYQNQIANLDASKQKEIEDAYYVRELSKKYLGEAQSNLGLSFGDVSGELLNIYGAYQSNISNINKYHKELELGLEQSYGEKKTGYELGFVQSQYENALLEEQQRKEGEFAEIQHNLMTGTLPEGMTNKDYLDSVRDTLGESNYWQLMTENKLLEQSQEFNKALQGAKDYKTQEEYDSYVDELLSKGSINANQAEQLKGMYNIERSTNFSEVPNDFNGQNITFYNPDNMNFKEDGKVYMSPNGDVVLAEKNTEPIYPGSNAYDNIRSYTVDEEGNELIGYDTVFAAGGRYYVKTTIDGEDAYLELGVSSNPNKLSNQGGINKETGNQAIDDMFDLIDKELGGKSGNYTSGTGTIAYTYDPKTNTYTPHVDFKASNVGDEKGNFLINGIEYKITKNKSIGNNTKHTELKGNLKEDGSWKKGKGEKFDVKDVIKEFTNIYFDGDTKAIYDYIQGSRTGLFSGSNWFNASQNTINNSSSMVIEYKGNYYTINDGELWRLEKK